MSIGWMIISETIPRPHSEHVMAAPFVLCTSMCTVYYVYYARAGVRHDVTITLHVE